MHLLLEQLAGHDHRGRENPSLDGDTGALPTPGEELRSPVRVSRFALQRISRVCVCACTASI